MPSSVNDLLMTSIEIFSLSFLYVFPSVAIVPRGTESKPNMPFAQVVASSHFPSIHFNGDHHISVAFFFILSNGFEIQSNISDNHEPALNKPIAPRNQIIPFVIQESGFIPSGPAKNPSTFF